jgi:hypothetical protein
MAPPMPYRGYMPRRPFEGAAMINDDHSWACTQGKMDYDDIRSFAEPEVANYPELHNCSRFVGHISRGGLCGISLVGR